MVAHGDTIVTAFQVGRFVGTVLGGDCSIVLGSLLGESMLKNRSNPYFAATHHLSEALPKKFPGRRKVVDSGIPWLLCKVRRGGCTAVPTVSERLLRRRGSFAGTGDNGCGQDPYLYRVTYSGSGKRAYLGA